MISKSCISTVHYNDPSPSEVASVRLIITETTVADVDSVAHTSTIPVPSVTVSMVGTDTDAAAWTCGEQ